MQGDGRGTKKGFSLVEMLIVVALLGILAAIVVPQFREQSTQAKESAARDNLRILRSMIEVYAAQHNDFPPGYVKELFTAIVPVITAQLCGPSNSSGETASESSADYNLGPYVSAIPKNPFNDKNTIKVLSAATPFPDPPTSTGTFGWIYKPSTKTIKLNYPGTDSKGVRYYDY